MFDVSSTVSIKWRKRIAKFCITRWRVEVAILSAMNCGHTRTCYLKLSRKLSLSHSWAVVVRIFRPNNEYELRNVISRHFYWKIINNIWMNETMQKRNLPTHGILPPSLNVIRQTVFDKLAILFNTLIPYYCVYI